MLDPRIVDPSDLGQLVVLYSTFIRVEGINILHKYTRKYAYIRTYGRLN